MSFTYKDYGTFTGPNSINGDYDYDMVSKEGFWYTDLPEDVSFKLTDLATVLFHRPGDYVGFYCYGTATQLMTFAHSSGNIPVVRVQSDVTIVNGQIIANGNIISNGNILANGFITENGIAGPTITALKSEISSKKSFDIAHPTKENHRLRYICIEGPAAEVYLRGKLKDSNVIELPDYWKDLVDQDTIGVTLTPIGTYQELFVEKIECGSKVIVKNNLGDQINCSFVVFAERKDVEKNISEYEGLTPADYPGDNNQYSINGLPGQNWIINVGE